VLFSCSISLASKGILSSLFSFCGFWLFYCFNHSQSLQNRPITGRGTINEALDRIAIGAACTEDSAYINEDFDTNHCWLCLFESVIDIAKSTGFMRSFRETVIQDGRVMFLNYRTAFAVAQYLIPVVVGLLFSVIAVFTITGFNQIAL
jgi:hypothetical protein